MKRGVYTLLIAQFLTAFADNAILFAAFAMILQTGDTGEWYKPALQASFLLAFVVLAPWVGRFADRQPKSRVLVWGNAIKAAGALLMLVQVEPLLAYAVVGIGAAVYGPAKYGILPELVGHDRLVRANGLMEGSTIIAIVLGAIGGGALADHSIPATLAAVAGTYGVSLLVALLIPKTPVAKVGDGHAAVTDFARMMGGFFSTSRARFSMLGASIFWSAAVVLRVMLVVWAPMMLAMHTTTEIAALTVFIAAGIAVGAVVVPWLVPVERLRRARVAAYVMGLLVLLLSATDSSSFARVVLFAIGLTGGIFVVPINAALQDIGHRTIGSGGAVAIQNFFENLAMLTGTALYSVALTLGTDPVIAMMTLSGLIIVATAVVSWRLPPDTAGTKVGLSVTTLETGREET